MLYGKNLLRWQPRSATSSPKVPPQLCRKCKLAMQLRSGKCRSNASLSWRETPDGWRWVTRASQEISDGFLHVHVGCVPSLQETLTVNNARNVNAVCGLSALMMVLVSLGLAPHLNMFPNPVERFMHSTLCGSLASLSLSMKTASIVQHAVPTPSSERSLSGFRDSIAANGPRLPNIENLGGKARRFCLAGGHPCGTCAQHTT